MNIPASSINRRDGLQLKQIMEQGQSKTVQFVYKNEQDRLADFSSRGPVTVSWGIKPDVLAPEWKLKAPFLKGICPWMEQVCPHRMLREHAP